MASSKDLAADPIDWQVAERVATQALRLVPPLEADVRRRLETDFAEATEHAAQLVEDATGLVSKAGPVRSRVTDRAGWVRANINSFQRMLRPLGERLASTPNALSSLTGPAGRSMAGAEVGLVLAWMSGRVLGQYDLLPVDANDEGDVVYYVGPNIAALEQRNAFPPGEFRLWIALHEVTHRLQFTGVPWMQEYFLGLVEKGTQLSSPDARSFAEALKRAAREMQQGRNPLAENGIVGLLASSEQMVTFREAQALMSVLEGHGDIVMSRAGRNEVPGAQRFGAVLSARRQSAKGLNKVAQQLLGIDAKLRQYAEGERFIEAVEEVGGQELMSRVWESPDMLPTLDEIRTPSIWIDRIRGLAETRA